MPITTPTTGAFAKDSHCSYCGAPFPAGSAGWPRACPACGNTTYRNPLPVAVLLIPVDGGGADDDTRGGGGNGGRSGVLLVRRALPDGRGRLALPGGYVNLGESWQQAAAREALEEIGVAVDPAAVEHVRTASAADGTLLVFGVARPVAADDLPPFASNDEAAERVVAREPIDLAFDLHTQVLREHFQRRDGRRV